MQGKGRYFNEGLEYVINKLEPATIVIYGSAPKNIFSKYEEQGIKILQFDSEFINIRKEGTD